MAERGKWVYGKSVVDGRVRFLAPTTIQKGDPQSSGCLRKWWFRYVMGWKETEEKSWTDLGKKCHAEIENYLITGANTLGPISSAAARFIPRPDPSRSRLLIEHDIGGGEIDERTGTITKASLFAAGVPIVGYTDIISDDPALDEDAAPCFDPPGTIENLDWKFGAAKVGSERDFSKKGYELATDTQMIAGGMWIASRSPSSSAPIRLSHVYTNTKGRPASSKATVLLDRGAIARQWEYVEAVVRTIKDVAKETNADKVPANTNACEAFGGCIYQKQCSGFKTFGVDSFFGGEGSLGLLAALNIT